MVRQSPKVTVLMATWNRAGLIGRAIESVRMQTFQDWEFIIVDDGSTDDTPYIVEREKREEERIVFLRNEHNKGISITYNVGLRAARGKYIAMIDDDDPWIPNDKLERQVAFLESHPDYVGCGGGVIVVSPVRGSPPEGPSGARSRAGPVRNLEEQNGPTKDNEKNKIAVVSNGAGETSNGMNPEGKELYRYLKPETDSAIRRAMLFSNPMANSTTMFRMDAAKKVGLYDESSRYSGDRDFWLKIGLVGKLYNFPEYFSYYTMGAENTSIAHLRPHLKASLAFMKRYKGKYPGYVGALLFNEAQYAYSFLPLIVRKKVHTLLARLKRRTVG